MNRMKHGATMTPREIVGELDRHIVGQDDAKRAVAVALRNRWRRRQLPRDLQEDVTPKNLILIGPTGVGKTEIARRVSKLVRAPFVKVEATRFTEVGYVGRDVESMVRDLVETGIGMAREEAREAVAVRAEKAAEERILDLLVGSGPAYESVPASPDVSSSTRDKMRTKLRDGELDDRQIEFDVKDNRGAQFEVVTPSGVEELGVNLKDMFGGLMGGKKRRRKVSIVEARSILLAEETDALLDHDQVTQDGLERAQQDGIIFLDEIDKVATQRTGRGPDVSREGVQRDLLPSVEGTSVHTKYGHVKTDHILFVAAGAFHAVKPSDLLPELQGRFPVRVELQPLKKEDFVRILTEPQNSLQVQYRALLSAEGVEVEFGSDAIDRIADVAFQANQRLENIGARRLTTVMERVLEELSFNAPERKGDKEVVDAAYVDEKMGDLLEKEDLLRYVL